MRNRAAFVTLAAAGAASLALAADFTMRPGRWETSASIQLPGGAELPPGFPFGGPIMLVQCISPEEAAQFRGFDELLPVENCELSRQETGDNAIRMTATCVEDGEEYHFDFLLTAYSSEHWAGEVKSRTGDPDLGELNMKFEARRTGDACSPEELAADEEE